MCTCSSVLCCDRSHLCGRGRGKVGCTCLTWLKTRRLLQCLELIFLHSKDINELQTMFETLVSLFPFRNGVIRTISTCELPGLRLALQPSETGLPLTHICNILTELPTESLGAQTPHHLEIRLGTNRFQYCRQTQLDKKSPSLITIPSWTFKTP